MSTRDNLIWGAVGVLSVACYLHFSPSTGVGGGSFMLEELRQALEKGPEARQWLRVNKHPGALASNRFESTAAALEFVDKLYAAGAVEVVISPDSIRPEPEDGGDYADALVVKLSDDLVTRQQVAALGEREAARDGMELGPEVAAGMMFLWWD